MNYSILLVSVIFCGLVLIGSVSAESSAYPGSSTNIVVLNDSSSGPSGFYEIRSNVDGAEVLFDDQVIGTIKEGVLRVQVPVTQKPSYSRMTIRADGYSPYSEVILQVPKNGQSLVIRGILSASSKNLTAPLSIAASPVGGTVFIDNKEVGVVDPSGIFTLRAVETGNRKIIIRLNGYQEWSQWLYVGLNSQNKVRATLVPITNGSLQVTSTPAGAGIFMNGGYMGITPLTIPDLNQGVYNVRLNLQGFQDYSTSATVQPGQVASVHGPLQPVVTAVPTTPVPVDTHTPEPTTTESGPLPIGAILGLFVVGILFMKKR